MQKFGITVLGVMFLVLLVVWVATFFLTLAKPISTKDPKGLKKLIVLTASPTLAGFCIGMASIMLPSNHDYYFNLIGLIAILLISLMTLVGMIIGVIYQSKLLVFITSPTYALFAMTATFGTLTATYMLLT